MRRKPTKTEVYTVIGLTLWVLAAFAIGMLQKEPPPVKADSHISTEIWERD
jgi:hypothetical protein